MQNAPKGKYSEMVEQCKQALTIIILNADLVLTHDTLSQERKKCLKEIKSQGWRIDLLITEFEKKLK